MITENKHKVKILLAANYAAQAGGISGQVNLLQQNLLAYGGWDVRIYSFCGGMLKRGLSYLKFFFAARKYDIIHIHACSHWGFLPALLGVPVGRLWGKRVVLTFHGGEGEQFFTAHPKVCRFVFSRTHRNIVLSGFLKEFFEKNGFKCSVIPNIIDYPESSYRKRSEFEPKYLSVRSLNPEYNVLCIIRAFERVRRVYPNALLSILGDGSQRRMLEDYVRDNGIGGVAFRGRIPNTDMVSALESADVFVSSPLVDNQPMSVLEAFSCGLLVISSNVGGIPYMIEDGVNGYLFNSDDSDQLSAKMILAVKDNQKSSEMTQNAFQGLDNYRWETVCGSILETYGLDK